MSTTGDNRAAPSSADVERWLSWIVLALILLALAIRVPLLFNIKLETDETEHLHAAWAVAHGQVPYRDFWQIHPPLLYYLAAPLFTLMGEDLRIIYVARGLMLLCLLLILLECYRIAKRCFDALTGLLAVLLLSYLLLWWRPAYDVRPDIPQTLLVLMSLRWFMRAWETRSRSAFVTAGALLGVAFWLLIKTLFPFAGLILVFALSAGLRRSAAALRESLTGLLCFLGGFVFPVALGGVLLWLAGAWPGFVQWTIVSSFRWPEERFSPFQMMHPDVHFMFWTLAPTGTILTLVRMVRASVVDEVQLSPLLAGSVTAAVYLFLMPIPYPQSALPFLPLAAIYGADVVRGVIARAVPPKVATPAGGATISVIRSPRCLAWAGLAALLLLGACVPPLRVVLKKTPLLRDQWVEQRQMIRYVLSLTSLDDRVFDSYGQYIFRPHATYQYHLSKAQFIWLRTGVMQEADIIDDLLRNQCKVVIWSPYMGELPPNLLRFLLSNYLSTGFRVKARLVLVAGKVLQASELRGNRATVSLVASAEYAVRVRGGTPKVYIDGQVYQAPRFLEQGDHHIVVEGKFEALSLLYNRALTVPGQPHG